MKALTDEDSFWAADALALMGPVAKLAVPALQQALQSRDGYTQLRAALALTKIDPQAPVDISFFIKLLNDQHEATRYETAAYLWTRTHDPQIILPTLVKLLDLRIQSIASRPHPYVIQTIQLLGEIGPPAKAAIPNLKYLESDGNSQLRDLVTAALKKIQTTTDRE